MIPHPDQDLEAMYRFGDTNLTPSQLATAQRGIHLSTEKARALLDACDANGTAPTSNASLSSDTPRMRLVAWLTAQGKSRTEIANILDVSPATVTNTLKHPSCKALVKSIIDEIGQDAVKTFLQTEVLSSLETLVAIRDSDEKGQVRIAAANSILDRALGKPTQHIESSDAKSSEAVRVENEALNSQLEAVEAQLRAIGAGSVQAHR
jgi:predicted transcriptional regulator